MSAQTKEGITGAPFQYFQVRKVMIGRISFGIELRTEKNLSGRIAVV